MEKTIDSVSAGLDKLVYTDEERAEDARKSRTEARNMLIKWMEATSGQNLTRRFIAFFITLIWGVQYLSMNILSVIAVWATDPTQYIATAKVIGGFATSMNGAMMLILAFYFAAPHMGSIVEGAMKKFGGESTKK